MAALVVTISPANGISERQGGRIEIFPGGTTTTMYAADTPFWIGYGFASDRNGDVGVDDATRFELDVDGDPVSMLTDLDTDSGAPVGKTNRAEFPDGLPVGWHDFTGRWYDAGRLILSRRAAIQFVER